MALVRKTQKLKEEIGKNLDGLVQAKVKKLMETLNLKTVVSQIVKSGVKEGQLVAIPIQEHMAELAKLDDLKQLNITQKLHTCWTHVNYLYLNDNAVVNYKEFYGEHFTLTSSNVVPKLKKNSIMGSYKIGRTHLMVAVDEYGGEPNAFLQINCIKDEEIVADKTVFGKNNYRLRMEPNASTEIPETIWSADQKKNMAILEKCQEKLAKSVARIEAVRTYIMTTLWPQCASLNAMAKPFPGILEYVDEETMKRYHKNAPRNQSMDPNLMPDATVLAATAEAKLK